MEMVLRETDPHPYSTAWGSNSPDCVASVADWVGVANLEGTEKVDEPTEQLSPPQAKTVQLQYK